MTGGQHRVTGGQHRVTGGQRTMTMCVGVVEFLYQSHTTQGLLCGVDNGVPQLPQT